MPFKPFLNWLSREGYGSLAFIDKSQAETYLLELWNKAPRMVFLTQLLGLMFIQLTPLLFFYRFKLFSRLSKIDNESFQKKLITSRWYSIRLLYYGVRAHALVAHFRNTSSLSQPLRLAS